MKNQTLKRILDGVIFLALLAAMTQTAGALPRNGQVPDGASTAALTSCVCAGLVALRRFRR